jgi:hypothetical protein
MDLAAEFFVNSFAVYCNNTYSQKSLARASKEKALKELQLFVYSSSNRPTYDVLLATKMHYAAEVRSLPLYLAVNITNACTGSFGYRYHVSRHSFLWTY